jgi:hypothetical protein
VARLRKIDPREWRSRIMELPVRMQVFVAQIVWWDYFSDKLVPNRWFELDLWINAHPGTFRGEMWPSSEEMVDALVSIGYEERTALRRLNMKKIRKCK